MGRGISWEDECEEEEGLVVGELCRRMGAEEWSMGEDALVMEGRVIKREFTTFRWVSPDSITQELSQIQYISSYVDNAHPVWADHPSIQR